MDAKRRVVLYGDSLLLTAVRTTLSTRRELCVISIDPSRTTALGDLDAFRPSALILDLTQVKAEAALALVRARPDLMLIGLDPAGDRLLVLSGPQAGAMTTDDLVRLIETQAETPERNRCDNLQCEIPQRDASGGKNGHAQPHTQTPAPANDRWLTP